MVPPWAMKLFESVAAAGTADAHCTVMFVGQVIVRTNGGTAGVAASGTLLSPKQTRNETKTAGGYKILREFARLSGKTSVFPERDAIFLKAFVTWILEFL